MIRWVIVSLANAAADEIRKLKPTKFNTRSFRQHFLSVRDGRDRLYVLIFAKNPNVLELHV